MIGLQLHQIITWFSFRITSSVCWVDGSSELELRTACLGCVELKCSTAVGHKLKIEDLIAEYPNLREKVGSFIADSTVVMPATARLMNLLFYGCFPHGVNLVVQNGLKSSPTFVSILQKLRDIRKLFKSSQPFKNDFIVVQSILKLPTNKLLKDMDVRWGSTLFMCDRYLQQSTAVIATCDRLQLKLYLPTQSELQQLRLVCKVLRTFDRVTTEMSSQKFVRSSQVGPFICICVYNFNYHYLN